MERIVAEWAHAHAISLRRANLSAAAAMSPSAIGARCAFGGRQLEGELLLAVDQEIFDGIAPPSAREGSSAFGRRLRARDAVAEAAQQMVGRLGSLLSRHRVRVVASPARAVSDPELAALLVPPRPIEHVFASGDHHLALRMTAVFAAGVRITERDRDAPEPRAPGSVVLFEDE